MYAYTIKLLRRLSQVKFPASNRHNSSFCTGLILAALFRLEVHPFMSHNLFVNRTWNWVSKSTSLLLETTLQFFYCIIKWLSIVLFFHLFILFINHIVLKFNRRFSYYALLPMIFCLCSFVVAVFLFLFSGALFSEYLCMETPFLI